MKTDVIAEAEAGEKDRRSIFETKAIQLRPVQGTFNQLLVDLFNAKTQTLLWCGIAQNALSNNGNKNQQMAGKAVQKIFKQWPQ
jgi:hypothetical protein